MGLEGRKVFGVGNVDVWDGVLLGEIGSEFIASRRELFKFWLLRAFQIHPE
jgi:hypothetical protein